MSEEANKRGCIDHTAYTTGCAKCVAENAEVAVELGAQASTTEEESPPRTVRTSAPTTAEERAFHLHSLDEIQPNADSLSELKFPQNWVQMWLRFDRRLMADVEDLRKASATLTEDLDAALNDRAALTEECAGLRAALEKAQAYVTARVEMQDHPSDREYALEKEFRQALGIAQA